MNFLKIAISLKWYVPLSSTIVWKMKKIIRAILEISLKNTIFQHLIHYNPGLNFFPKNCRLSLMQKVKRILRAVLEKNWGQTTKPTLKNITNYGSDLIGPFPTKGRGPTSNLEVDQLSNMAARRCTVLPLSLCKSYKRNSLWHFWNKWKDPQIWILNPLPIPGLSFLKPNTWSR